MYERLLARFCENQADTARQLTSDRQRGDVDAMILRVHSLRGLAGTLGASALANLAGDLEIRLKRGTAPNDAELDTAFLALDANLSATLRRAAELREHTPPPVPVEVDPVSADVLSDLHRLLDNDDADAVQLFEEIAGRLQDKFDPHLVEQLARQINHYAFDDAKETLRQMNPQRSAP